MSWPRFLAALLALPLLGAGAAFHPSVRSEGLLARIAAALALGAVTLTLTGVLLTFASISWSIPAMAAPPLCASLALGLSWSRKPAPPRRPYRPSRGVAFFAIAVTAVSLLCLFWTLATAGATSVDFLYFWGAKAARFAAVRGIDTALLRWTYFGHGVPDYPPSVPILQAWGALAAGKLPWRFVPVCSLLWVAAAAPLVLALLRRRLSDDAATAVASFWIAATSITIAQSYSGGNAEAQLLFFETLAVASLLVEDEDAGADASRFLPALMLAGAVLTKVEGSVAALAIAAGATLRDALERRGPLLRRALPLVLVPAACVLTWFAFQRHFGLTVGYRSHGPLFLLRAEFLPTILREELRNLDAGTFGLAWAIPIAFLLAARPDPRRLLPALALIAALFGFLTFDYMHDQGDPSERIGWTTPRVSQSALSACILAAGLAWFGPARRKGEIIAAEASPQPR
jgi:hypothetical protein